MATWAIGDVQGCFEPLMRLVEAVDFAPGRDRLWLCGDLVNRGPASLEVLRWCVAHDAQLVAVLGNHDVYLLARWLAGVEQKDRDTVQAVLDAPDAPALLGWLRARPLLHREGDQVLVHAGVAPGWTITEAEAAARSLEGALRGAKAAKLLRRSFAVRPRRWDPDAKRLDRLVTALALFTRMRCFTSSGALDYDYTGPLDRVPDGLTPWWRVPGRPAADHMIWFGHWAAVGVHREGRICALDSGCVWGRSLSAVCLDDGRVVRVARDP